MPPKKEKAIAFDAQKYWTKTVFPRGLCLVRLFYRTTSEMEKKLIDVASEGNDGSTNAGAQGSGKKKSRKMKGKKISLFSAARPNI